MKRIIRFQLCLPAHKQFNCNIIVNFNIIKYKIRKTSYLTRFINLGRYPHRSVWLTAIHLIYNCAYTQFAPVVLTTTSPLTIIIIIIWS